MSNAPTMATKYESVIALYEPIFCANTPAAAQATISIILFAITFVYMSPGKNLK